MKHLDEALVDRLREIGATDDMLAVLEQQLEVQRLRRSGALESARVWAKENRKHLDASLERLRLEPPPPGRNVIVCATPFGTYSFEELVTGGEARKT